MPVSDAYLAYIIEQLQLLGAVTTKRMFGGAGIYMRGKMFGLIAADVLFLKADDANRADFERAGMEKFKPWNDKPMTMPYYEVPADVLEDRTELAKWARKSVAAAETTKKKP